MSTHPTIPGDMVTSKDHPAGSLDVERDLGMPPGTPEVSSDVERDLAIPPSQNPSGRADADRGA